MSKWGVNYDETFNVTTLTTDFVDNTRLANTPYVIQAFIYVDYTKGSENYLEIKVEQSNIDDTSVATERYFQETIVDNNGNVELFTFKVFDSGKYRLPIAVGESEDRIKVSVRGAGVPPFSGTVDLYYGVR